MNNEHLSVAIIGAGPAGFYAAGALVSQKEFPVSVDIFDRLPAPYGLVRYGVAPDHEKIRNVIRIYQKTAANEAVRFFGNVEYGTDITHRDLLASYDRVIYTTGAPSDRNLGIPGEDLEGSRSATEFVAWYNGHPDYVDLNPNLDIDSVIVVGVGNVAIDVARILARSIDELSKTDIADHALDSLSKSKVKDIYVIGRRGPAQAKFTNPEIREFGKLEIADAVVRAAELELDPASAEVCEHDRTARVNLEILNELAEAGITGKEKRVHFRFLASPVEIYGEGGRVEAVKLERNRLEATDSGYLNSVGTGEFETIEAGMILRSVGYRGVPLPDVPFESRRATIPNEAGRINDPDSGSFVPREYVAGWAKRGPTGVIGTNKADAVETVKSLFDDVRREGFGLSDRRGHDDIMGLLRNRDIRFVSYDDWRRIEALEQERGEAQGRPRLKFVSVDDMLAACAE
ncbi:MAG: FAD-dependent oxidoreductase [Rhodothermia bacterium]